MENINFDIETPKKKKPRKKIWITITILAVVIIASSISITTLATTEENEPEIYVSNTSMIVDYNELLGYAPKIIGTAKNTTLKNFSYVQIEFSIYDANGINLGSAFANIGNLASGETWSFETVFGFTNAYPQSFKLVDISFF